MPSCASEVVAKDWKPGIVELHKIENGLVSLIRGLKGKGTFCRGTEGNVCEEPVE